MLTNAKQIITIAILIAITSSIVTYAFTAQNDPEILIDKENKKTIRECLISIDYESTPYKIQSSIKSCSQLELKKIVGGNKLDNDTIVSSDSGVKKNIEYKDIRIQICKKVPNSPLCNEENYNMARSIAYKKALIWGIEDREEFFRVWLGIMNSESTIGTNYAWTCDSSYNNFGGIKWRILDTGEAIKDQKIPQWKDNKCWLYKFNSQEDYFWSKYNSLGKWYGKCFKTNDPIYCISGYYVWKPYSPSWINNVKSIANLK